MAKRTTSKAAPEKPKGWDRAGEYRGKDGSVMSREEFLRKFGYCPKQRTDPYTLWLISQSTNKADKPAVDEGGND